MMEITELELVCSGGDGDPVGPAFITVERTHQVNGITITMKRKVQVPLHVFDAIAEFADVGMVCRTKAAEYLDGWAPSVRP